MIGKNSRYAGSIVVHDASGDTLGTRQRLDATPLHDDQFHAVVDGDRLDLIAHRHLGDARLWWIIADYNDIFFPLDLETGAILRIPSVEHVQMRLLT